MTTNLRRNSDEVLPPSTESEDKPHFFKIIHSIVLGEGKLGIPKGFVRRYGKILSDTMFLKTPNGAVWKVGLMRSDDEVWLQSGWQEFAEYYSIGYGHFLVFRYDGETTFRVLIFDKTASEIEYPSTTNDQYHQEPSLPTMTESVEILDVFPAGDKTKEKDRVDATSSGEGDSPCFPETVEIESDVSVGMFEVPPTRESYGRVDTIENCVMSKAPPPVTANKEFGAVERAGAYNPGNPFFRVKMGPSYASGRPPTIPMWFVKRHLKTDNKCITVWMRDGRTWSMKSRLIRGSFKRSAVFSSDWRIFMRDNQLKLGDVCVFELIKSPFILLKVVIFRNNEDAADQ